MLVTVELTGAMRVRSGVLIVPAGVTTLPVLTARITSWGDMPYARRRFGSTLITMVRWLPPKGGGADTPGRVANCGRTRFRARSWISPRLRVGLANTR